MLTEEEVRALCPKWYAVNWKKIKYKVDKIKGKIAFAYSISDWKRVSQLQKQVLNSYTCRMYAVHQVTQKRMKRTAGIDRIFWHSDEERFNAVEKLKDYNNYQPTPFKRTYVPKDHDKSKKRPLSVPVIYDRAMQALMTIAIDPIVECTAGMHDYGSRKYRSNQDAVRDIYCTFQLTTTCPYILKTDITQCFDHLSHKWIFQHTPFNKKLLKKIIKCSYLFKGKLYQMHEGVPQGGVYAPSLINLSLNGFERVLTAKYGKNKVHMVRFVDDFLFSSGDVSILQDVLATLKEFLAERGMYLSDEKTEIKHISEGVDYIGRHIVVKNGTLYIKPSEQAIREKKKKVKDIVEQAKNWTIRQLVLKLNDSIRGWGQHYNYLSPDNYIYEMDDWLQDVLWEWATRRYNHHKPQWIYHHLWIWDAKHNRKAFGSAGRNSTKNKPEEVNNGNSETEEDDGVYLERFIDQKTKLKEHFDLSKNAYLDRAYFKSQRKVNLSVVRGETEEEN